jgi:hypothetical protein
MPLNRPSFASLPCDLRDGATCTSHRRSSSSFEVKLGNPSPTFFEMNQVVVCRCVSSHHLHPLMGFEAQTDKPSPTWFWGSNQKTVAVILWAKSINCSCGFWGSNRETRRPWFWGLTKKPTLHISLCTVQISHGVTRPPDRPTTEYSTCAWPSSVLCIRSPTPV